jgi:hypothetical protein
MALDEPTIARVNVGLVANSLLIMHEFLEYTDSCLNR